MRLLFALFIAGCASSPPPELINARTAYSHAAASQAAQWAPAELHKAHEALARAEQSFADDPESYRTRDLAYIAERKSELSEALAAGAEANARHRRAESDYAATQGRLIAQSRDLINQTKAAERERKLQEQIESERQARAGAEQKAAEATQKAADAERRAKEAQEQLSRLAAVKEEPRGMVITLSGSVLFPSNQSVLLPEAQERLSQVADALLATRERNITVEGYTDSRGSDEHNLILSQQRAEAVRTFLVQRGYEPDRINARGYGRAKPIADNGSPEGRANNRRVEIVVEPARP